MHIIKYSVIPVALITALLVLNFRSPGDTPTPANQAGITASTLQNAKLVQPKISAARGHKIAKSNGCFACHSINGTKMAGPTWKNLYGHKVELKDGSTIVADSAYIHQSIVDPTAKVTKGFAPTTMPAFTYLKKAQIASLIAYIKTLSDASKSGKSDG